ncbi:uncharacterized protein G2W53_014286 [Senna tora]|uniref:Uncharacterized protein n=1 Tax=Senna tora TaxID=362788 RepID=A0A834WT22_9FABA|nr:uncharacterized protein G2W53_014286 [Senna tora]
MGPIRALNTLGFENATRSDRHDFTHLPCDHDSHSNIKSTRIPKYNAKRSIQSRFSVQNVFRNDMTHLPWDHKSLSSIKSTRIPKYNAKQSV